jgi:hypothetical protein
MRRLVIVLADGLRPDAVTPSVMPSLDALGSAFTLARQARTIRPSATVPALASLATGVSPQTHQLTEPGPSTGDPHQRATRLGPTETAISIAIRMMIIHSSISMRRAAARSARRL